MLPIARFNIGVCYFYIQQHETSSVNLTAIPLSAIAVFFALWLLNAMAFRQELIYCFIWYSSFF
jgi:hypothetical protein